MIINVLFYHFNWEILPPFNIKLFCCAVSYKTSTTFFLIRFIFLLLSWKFLFSLSIMMTTSSLTATGEARHRWLNLSWTSPSVWHTAHQYLQKQMLSRNPFLNLSYAHCNTAFNAFNPGEKSELKIQNLGEGHLVNSCWRPCFNWPNARLILSGRQQRSNGDEGLKRRCEGFHGRK